MNNKLPSPTPAALTRSNKLTQKIIQTIHTHGPLPLSDYIQLALYDAQLGYYQNDEPFQQQGDFITAAHCGPWFGQMLANQIQQIIAKTKITQICEYAAGDGNLALQLLLQLQKNNTLPNKYIIIEQSQHLIEKQKLLFSNFPNLLKLISWQQDLPKHYEGIVFANELLDAFAFNQFKKTADDQYLENFVNTDGNKIYFEWLPQKSSLPAQTTEYQHLIPNNYIFEINNQSFQWLSHVYQQSNQAICLLIDYGFPAQTYFARGDQGYARAFYKHHVHDDLLLWPGLQDITTHVNFTQIALEAVDSGWDILGFSNQANFLLGCGIEHLHLPKYDTAEGIKARAEIKTLLMPHEMGETFKILAISKNIDLDLIGFEHDISYQL